MKDLIVWLQTGDNFWSAVGACFVVIWLLGHTVSTIRSAWRGDD